MKEAHELAIIMPVYNESGAIGTVVKKWSAVLDALAIDYSFHVYNDGSKDNTLEILNELSGNYDRLIVHDKKNSGHGPTILLGYRENSNCKWIFQTDSDDELPPDDFEILWKNRNDYDFLIGIRDDRDSKPIRKFITGISRLTVRVFYGKGVKDVNSPYRLYRTSVFKTYFEKIPENTFAPNVILSGIACLKKIRIFQTYVKHQNRQTGTVSIKRWKLLKAALKSYWQTFSFRFKI